MSSRRLAVFAPVPPARSGIAEYVEGMLPLLPTSWEIEVFADGDTAGELAGWPVNRLEDWGPRHHRAPFDLNVYHVGNNALHATTLPYVLKHPGLLVLHDVVMHPARAAVFLGADDMRGYSAALAASETERHEVLAQVIAAGLGGPSIYWNFLLSEDLIRASRHTVVHGQLLARWLQAQVPGVGIGSVVNWLPVSDDDGERTLAWRTRVGAGEAIPLFGTFGHIGPEHRVELLLEVLGELASDFDFRLVVVGAMAPELDLERTVRDSGLSDRVEFTGRVDDEDYGALLRAVDLGLNLRYPTARASSGPLVQMLQVGTPAVIHDLVHLRDLPEPAVLRVPTGEPNVEVAGLRLQLRRWLEDADWRASAASAAAEWGRTRITPDAMRRSYEKAVDAALAEHAVA